MVVNWCGLVRWWTKKQQHATAVGPLYVDNSCWMQEAVCVGMTAAFRDVDSLVTAYRCHGWAYCWGWSVKQVLAELFGREGVAPGLIGLEPGLGSQLSWKG